MDHKRLVFRVWNDSGDNKTLQVASCMYTKCWEHVDLMWMATYLNQNVYGKRWSIAIFLNFALSVPRENPHPMETPQLASWKAFWRHMLQPKSYFAVRLKTAIIELISPKDILDLTSKSWNCPYFIPLWDSRWTQKQSPKLAVCHLT